MFLIYFASGLSWLWIAQGLLGIGYGLAYPILLGMVMECQQPSEHSIATGFPPVCLCSWNVCGTLHQRVDRRGCGSTTGFCRDRIHCPGGRRGCTDRLQKKMGKLFPSMKSEPVEKHK